MAAPTLAIGERAQAPIFLLLDLAALGFDDGLQMGRKRVDRLRADILARDQHVLVKSHERSFLMSAARSERGGFSAGARRIAKRRTIRHNPLKAQRAHATAPVQSQAGNPEGGRGI